MGITPLERHAVSRPQGRARSPQRAVSAIFERAVTLLTCSPRFSLCLWLTLLLSISPVFGDPTNHTTVLIVVGAAGEAEYGSNFVRQASLWQSACERAGARPIMIGWDEAPHLQARTTALPLPEGEGRGEGERNAQPNAFRPLNQPTSTVPSPRLLPLPEGEGERSPGQTNDLALLQQALADEPKEGPEDLWIVFIGHGTFDGKEARFNLRGPDVSATDLAAWLKPFRRPLAIINTASCSAPFLNKLSGTHRVVITATRSGNEQSFARFGQYFAEAIGNPEADLDKDGQVSLLEAFLMASRRAGEFYQTSGRMASEHALLDDNGDGLGTQADWFRGVRAIKKPSDKAAADGFLANQMTLIRSDADAKLSASDRARRDELERTVSQLREKKSQMSEEDYYRQLEKLLLELARIYGPGPS